MARAAPFARDMMTWVSPMLVVLLVAADPATLFATEATPGLIMLTFIVVVIVVLLIVVVLLLLLKVVSLYQRPGRW